MKIAVVTDSGSGIEKSDIGNLFVIGMPLELMVVNILKV